MTIMVAHLHIVKLKRSLLQIAASLAFFQIFVDMKLRTEIYTQTHLNQESGLCFLQLNTVTNSYWSSVGGALFLGYLSVMSTQLLEASNEDHSCPRHVPLVLWAAWSFSRQLFFPELGLFKFMGRPGLCHAKHTTPINASVSSHCCTGC